MRVVLDIRDPDPEVVARLARIHLEGVVAQNRVLLRRNSGRIPPLYESGVRFRNEPWAGKFKLGGANVPGIEEFATIPVVLGRGWGDCAQLCCWRIAELREAAIARGMSERDAQQNYGFRIYWRLLNEGTENERRFFHVQVRHPPLPGQATGAIEDPSRFLEY